MPVWNQAANQMARANHFSMGEEIANDLNRNSMQRLRGRR
jgi:hypothetical protein